MNALVATITNTNSTLADVLTLSNSKLITSFQDVTRLTSTISELRRKLGNPNPDTSPDVGWVNRHYCWTCGYTCKQSSCNYPSPATGHQKGTNKANSLGGSTKFSQADKYRALKLMSILF